MPRDERFALTIILEDGQNRTQHILYYPKTFSIGQALDQLCKQFNLEQVTDFGDVQGSALKVFAMSLDGTTTPLPFATKMTEICGLVEGFEQGDSVLVRR